MKPTKTQLPVSSTRKSSRRGFTLVELLVVITIIIALAAVAFLATRNIRTKATQANAMSSLRQVMAFNVAYSTENNGDINTMRWVGDPKEGGGGAWVKNSFWGRLAPYLSPDGAISNQGQLKKELDRCIDRVFSSTDADKMAGTALTGAKIYHDGSGLPVPLAFNNNLYKWNEFIKTTSVSDPSQVIYLTYGFGFFKEDDGQQYTPIPRDNSIPQNNIYYLEDRKALAGFLDGHVELVAPPIPDRRYK